MVFKIFKKKLNGLKIGLSLMVVFLLILVFPQLSFANNPNITVGDGHIVYGVSGNTTPQQRLYEGGTNSFTGATGTTAGATPISLVYVVAPVTSNRNERLVGYVNSGGNLYVMMWNGSSWSNTAWSPVSVGGTGTTRRFDIAYEQSSGEAVVFYSTNATTNELAFRVWNGSTWAGPTTYDPSNTSSVISWVTARPKPNSNDIGLAYLANSSTGSVNALIWNGTSNTLGNQGPSITDDIEETSAVGDSQAYDIAYESSSGDLLFVWGIQSTGNTTNTLRYVTYTGTWGTPTTYNLGTNSDDLTVVDLASDPDSGSNQILFVSYGASVQDVQASVWSGSAWGNNATNIDAAAHAASAGKFFVAAGWVINGANKRGIVIWADAVSSPSDNQVDYRSFTPGTGWSGNLAYSKTFGDDENIMMGTDPNNLDRAMITISDENSDLWAVRVQFDGTNLNFSNADGGTALETSLSTIGAVAYGFTYNVPTLGIVLSVIGITLFLAVLTRRKILHLQPLPA